MDKKYSNTIVETIKTTPPVRILSYGFYEVSYSEILDLWNELNSNANGFQEKPDETFIENHKYAFYQVEIPIGQWTRDGIVNAIIRAKYRIDEMEAITNNMAAINAVFMQTLVTEGIVAATKYLKESINDENTARFKEMQEWRAMAKQVAKEILEL